MLKSSEASPEEISEAGLFYRVWRPEAAVAGSSLVVLVHGRTGDANVMWTFSKVVAQLECVVVAPQGFLVDQLGGWSWWNIAGNNPNSSARTGVAAADLSVAQEKMGAFVRWCVEHYHCDPKRVVGIGFSQGGALLATTPLVDPELFAGVAMLASFVPHVAFDQNLISERVRNREVSLPPYFFANGNRDEIIEIARARAGAEKLRALGAEVEFVEDDVGHKVGSASLKALGAWIARRFSSK